MNQSDQNEPTSPAPGPSPVSQAAKDIIKALCLNTHPGELRPEVIAQHGIDIETAALRAHNLIFAARIGEQDKLNDALLKQTRAELTVQITAREKCLEYIDRLEKQLTSKDATIARLTEEALAAHDGAAHNYLVSAKAEADLAASQAQAVMLRKVLRKLLILGDSPEGATQNQWLAYQEANGEAHRLLDYPVGKAQP